MPQSKEVHKDYMRERRKGSQKGGFTTKGSQDPMLYLDGTKALLFTPSKFLSQEQDVKVQENVLNTMKLMSGSRLQQFRGLGNVFTPNTQKDTLLKIPV